MSAPARFAATIRRFGFARNRTAAAAEPAASDADRGRGAPAIGPLLAADLSELASPSTDHRAARSAEWGGVTTHHTVRPLHNVSRSAGRAPSATELDPSSGLNGARPADPPAPSHRSHASAPGTTFPVGPAAPPSPSRPSHAAATPESAESCPSPKSGPYITHSRKRRRGGVPTSPRILIATTATILALAVPAVAAAEAPTIDRETLWEPTQTSIVLNAQLNPHNEELTDCHFEWGEGSSLDHEITCAGVDEIQVVSVSGAEAGQFTLSFEGQKTPDLAFDASATAVQGALEALSSVGSGNVLVSGGSGSVYEIFFRGSLTETDVPQILAEDGTEPLSGGAGLAAETFKQGAASAVEAINSQLSDSFSRVTAALSGLTPNTEYSFRLFATNAAGTEAGEVRSFTTLEEAAPEECANEKFRQSQEAGYLPECRAYEMVTPLEKGHGDIVGDGATTVASRFGDAVAFNSRTPFGDTIGSGTIGQTQYVARRTDQGWDAHGVTPRPQTEAVQTFYTPTLLQLYSDDLRTAVVRGYDLPDAGDEWPDGWPPRNNIYVEDTATRDLQTVTLSQVDPPTIPDFISYPYAQFWGISADAHHLAFVTSTRFLPNAAPGKPNVYKWDDGVLSVASVLPNGNVATNGKTSTPANLRGAMSADGSRLLFTTSTGGNVQLFLRIDNSETAWVSQTELDPLDPNYQPDPANVKPLGMTPNGKNVFFTTSTSLLPGDTNSGTDLYRYTDSADPANDDNLTLISQGGDLAGGQVVGMSDDGERVYYQTDAPRLEVWDHGTTQLVSATASFHPTQGFSLNSATPGYARVSPDGMFLAFGTNETVDDVHGLTGAATNRHLELYLYSLADDTLACVSCPIGPATADTTVLPAVTDGLNLSNAGFRPRFLSDGGRVFFSTAEALSPQDTNGVLDAYQYDPATAQISLLSSGVDESPSTFADAGASGDDVFLVTRDSLVPSDTDQFVDLYDVRAGGGFPEPIAPPVKPCSGDRCKGSPTPTPDFATPGSSAVGRGNLTPPRRPCRRGKVRRHGKCVSHKSKHHHGKRANKNRRAPK